MVPNIPHITSLEYAELHDTVTAALSSAITVWRNDWNVVWPQQGSKWLAYTYESLEDNDDDTFVPKWIQTEDKP